MVLSQTRRHSSSILVDRGRTATSKSMIEIRLQVPPTTLFIYKNCGMKMKCANLRTLQLNDVKYKQQGNASTSLRTEDNLECCLPVITDSIRRAPKAGLPRTSPTLIRRAVPREAGLRRTILVVRIDTDPNVRITAFHDTEIISRSRLTGVFAVAKFEKSLRRPLASSAPFCVTRESHSTRP